MRRSRWSASALEDVEAITRYIAEHNLDAADRMADLFLMRPKRWRRILSPIAQAANSAHARPWSTPNYILVYQVSDDAVRILRLLHARQQYP